MTLKKLELITDYTFINRTLRFKAIDELENVYIVKGSEYHLQTLKELDIKKHDTILVRCQINAWGELLLSKVLCRGDD